MKVVVAALALAGCADDGGPRLRTITPASAALGAIVELDGTGFCGPSGDCTNVAASVVLGDTSPFYDASPVTWTATVATVELPTAMPPGTSRVVMTVDGRASNGLDVDVLAARP